MNKKKKIKYIYHPIPKNHPGFDLPSSWPLASDSLVRQNFAFAVSKIKVRMTSELCSDHPRFARMTWSLCDHHFFFSSNNF
jgi:hypothetical protein